MGRSIHLEEKQRKLGEYNMLQHILSGFSLVFSEICGTVGTNKRCVCGLMCESNGEHTNVFCFLFYY